MLYNFQTIKRISDEIEKKYKGSVNLIKYRGVSVIYSYIYG